MKTAMASNFYDKEFTLCNIVESTDEELEVINTPTLSDDSFFGNISFDRLDKTKQDYGLSEEIDAKITTGTQISLNQVFFYNDDYFKVYRAIPFDSHYLLLVQKWSSKSSTTPSA